MRCAAIPHRTLAGFLASSMALSGLSPPDVAGAAEPPLREAAMPPAGWTLAFQDDFRSLDLWDGRTGTWEPRFPWGGRSDPSSREIEYYVDPRKGGDPEPLQALAPLSLDARGASLNATPIPPALRGAAGGQAYASGMLNSLHGFSFTYGYVDVRAEVPTGKGLWLAIWLLRTTIVWPPEIDVMEAIGGEDDHYYATLHGGTAREPVEQQEAIPAPDLRRGFHDYGLLWTEETIDWYYDGRRVMSAATPPTLHAPLYLLLNFAVGGKWAGPPDERTRFPASFRIARVRVFQQPATANADRP